MTNEERKRTKQINRFFYGLTSVTNNIYYQMVNQKILPYKFSIRRSLRERGIVDSASLKSEIERLITFGYRKEFNELRNELLIIPEEEREKYITLEKLDTSKKRKMKVVQEYFYRLPENTIAAIDYADCIIYCIYGLKAGYLTKEEAWEYKLKAARLAQQSYSGWMEYILAYFAGKQFVKKDEESYKSDMCQYAKDITKLIASKYSPVNKVQWDIEL